MGWKTKLADKIIRNSSLYEKQTKEIKKLNNKVDNLKEVNKSTNRLFNSILLDYELTPRPLLKNFQNLSVELLKFADNICNKYGLEWMVEGGTFLGAVRHGGFIPWDDDLDSGMFRSDYNRFIEVLNDELDNHNLRDIFYLRFKPADRYCEGATSFLQIIIQHDDPYTIPLAALDVFPYDYLRDYNGEDIGDKYEDARINFHKDQVELKDMDLVLKNYYENLDLTYEKTPYFVPGIECAFGPTRLFGMHVFETDKMIPFQKIDFEDITLHGPKDADYYLNILYGNYRRIPQKVTFHNRMKRLRKYPNVNQAFESKISRLRDVNDSF